MDDPGAELIEPSVALVRRWLREAAADERRSERRSARQLHRLTDDPGSVAFAMAFLDRVVRPDSLPVAAAQLRVLAAGDLPSFLSPIDRIALRAGAALSGRFPSIVMPIARRRLRQLVGDLVLDADDPKLARQLAALAGDGFEVNVNLLGEAVLGDEEADRRRQGILDLIARPDVRCVSVKASSITAQLHLWDHEGTVERVADRLRPVLRAAATAPVTLVNLDMEEYKDLRLTLDVFKTLLDEPEFADLHAGLALQAYLPDSTAALDELTVWAQRRRANGAAPVRVRIVKGANLAMERVDAAIHGWELATFSSKADVDANYKRMIDAALSPARVDAVHLGVASHNLFDVAWALNLARARGLAGSVVVEMLQGMAPSLARTVRRDAGRLLLYAPVVAPADFDAALAYLFRRLEENAGGENFLRHLFELDELGPAFDREAERFALAVRARRDLDVSPNRHRPVLSGPVVTFENAADTDPTDPVRRAAIWAAVDGRPSVGIGGLADEAGIDGAVERAVPGAASWSRRDADERAALLRGVAVELERRRPQLIATMAREAAKAVGEGDVEVSEAVDFANYYADRIGDLGSMEGARFEPLGVVVVVPPWNFPLAIPMGGALAALAAGNAVILKSAPETPATAKAAADACWAAGIPADALQYVRCKDGPVGERLIGHPHVGGIVLTGSTETAELFRRLAPETPLFAETSGKNAIVVLPDADLDLAVADLVRSAFGHAGQKCSAASLAILVGEVATSDRFRRQLVDATRSLAVGVPESPGTVVGPLIGPPSEKLRRGLGRPEPGETWLVVPTCVDEERHLWSPGIRDGVRPGSWFHRTECFGPVLGLMAAADLDEAIAMQNATGFGLTGGIHSLDPSNVARWLERVEVGNAYVNRGITGAIVQRQPFGGWKGSVVGPGAKAGGPNYVAQLGTWHDDDGPLTWRADADWWAEEFAADHDPSELFCESNVFRYRPISPFVVRVGPGTDADDLARVLAAIEVVGADAHVSRATDEDASTFWSRIADEAPPRVRLLGRERPPADLPVTIYVDARPVVRNGRIELARYLREQAVSTTLHRYGNLVRPTLRTGR